MHQCIGPCEFDIDPKVYDEMSDKVVRFMNGDTKDVETQLQTKMLEASQALEFEKAQEYKEMLESIRHVVNDKQNIEKIIVVHVMSLLGIRKRDILRLQVS